MTATNGPLRRLYTPNRPSTGIFVGACPGAEESGAAAPGSIPASFLATTVTRAPPTDSGPRAIDRHCLFVFAVDRVSAAEDEGQGWEKRERENIGLAPGREALLQEGVLSCEQRKHAGRAARARVFAVCKPRNNISLHDVAHLVHPFHFQD